MRFSRLMPTAAFSLSTLPVLTAIAGPLTPPAGPVSPTAKPLGEIEPRIAVNAANTPGDADSLFRITQPGSYYLAGNVTGVAGKHGVEIAASGVTLDLGGFDLSGVAGSLFDGVTVSAANLTAIAVRNGSIRGWGQDGVDLQTSNAAGAEVSGVRARGNGGAGIALGGLSSVNGCVATGNGAIGISVVNGCLVTGCVAAANAQSGIVAGATCIVSGCSADGNGVGSTGATQGIFAGDGSTVTGCSAQNNISNITGGAGDRGMGFRVGNRCLVRECVAARNLGHGFRLVDGTLITGCVSEENGSGSTVSAGISIAGSGNRAEGNHTDGSDVGVQALAGGNIILRTTAWGNGTNYSFVADNLYGQIIDRRIPATVASTPAVSGSAAAAGTLGTTDPNANFSY